MTDITSIPGWQDMTGEQLFAFTQANPQTAAPVPAAPMQKWLRLNDLLMRVDGVFVGIIPAIAANPQTPVDMARKIRGMLSEFEENPLAAIETDQDEYAPLFAWMMGSVSLPDDEIAKFYSLGGGRKYPLFASAEAATAAKDAALSDAVETTHRQKARLAGVRFGEQFAIDGDPGETMAAIWEAI